MPSLLRVALPPTRVQRSLHLQQGQRKASAHGLPGPSVRPARICCADPPTTTARLRRGRGCIQAPRRNRRRLRRRQHLAAGPTRTWRRRCRRGEGLQGRPHRLPDAGWGAKPPMARSRPLLGRRRRHRGSNPAARCDIPAAGRIRPHLCIWRLRVRVPLVRRGRLRLAAGRGARRAGSRFAAEEGRGNFA